MFSGGVCSFLAAIRAAERFGKENVTLLFSDTQIEDEDLYRFLEEGATYLGCELVRLKTKTMRELVLSNRAMPSDRMPFCSRDLKVEPAIKWVKENAPEAICVFGITWVESHRAKKVEQRWENECWFPLIEPETMFKGTPEEECNLRGIEIPRLYKLGFPHNNCGGTCVRGGIKAWVNAYKVFPERVLAWANLEDEISEMHGKPCAILRDRGNYSSRPLPLRELIAKNQVEPKLFDDADLDEGCSCFTLE
jgi:3'-phosphoadenosine 5'-phosphosulfate sulfotransferase (PAPS reductase)/FAD synthetase